jgi:hypothetical protein
MSVTGITIAIIPQAYRNLPVAPPDTPHTATRHDHPARSDHRPPPDLSNLSSPKPWRVARSPSFESSRRMFSAGWADAVVGLCELTGRATITVMSERDETVQFFESFYAGAGDDYSQIPWARLSPGPPLIDWLDAESPAAGTVALVVACGLGDDAEELARRGCVVEAFDVSYTAIETARRRFPD